eukprot:TRINITY_DN11888_c0_g1_i2.p1 TRINITY_DN11888_c0_g1~~TRINITY_DN11888_c0_g1_i2.p1  ORF type:complete len:100 (-),score=4.46 TRINITY_DN11888_c0_g1_i2:408-707(-)
MSTAVVTSSSIILKNMFDSSDAMYDDWENELKNDLNEECSKFGSIRHIQLDKQFSLVYIHFDHPASAQTAQAALSGRWYAGRVLTCELITDEASISRNN